MADVLTDGAVSIVQDEKKLREVSRRTSSQEMERLGLWGLMRRALNQLPTGVGISAIQLGYPLRACLLRLTTADGKVSEIGMVNPEIVKRSPSSQARWNEGCLSFPEKFVNVWRDKTVAVKDEINGEITFRDFHAAVILHEMDHMDGVLYLDREAVPIRRDQPRVGRNDSCPCGSGAKYKKCCGR